MTEEKLTKIVAEVAKLLAKDVYGDALKPGMTQIGKAIETVIGLGNTVLTPIAMVNDKVKYIREKNLAKLNAKLIQIEAEKIGDIHPEIAVPVLRKLEYTQNEELAELFLNLLTTAANIDTAHLAHPSFVNIISNISPDEAKILNHLKINGPLCYVSINSNNKDNTFSSYRIGTTILEFENIIEFKTNASIYISNLIGQGVIRDFASPANNPQIEKIQNFLASEIDEIKKMEKVLSLHLRNGSFGLTKFGELFLECCTR